MAYMYPYGDTQQLNLSWFLSEFDNLKKAWEQEKAGIEGALDAEIAKAEAALADVFAARDTAVSASQTATTARTEAVNASQDASGYAVSAAGSAQNASNSEIAARQSATLAEEAKATAIQKGDQAVQAANTAVTSAQNAGQSAANAAASETAAAGSATTAGEEADRAETAADEVADSVTQIASNTSDISDLKESINTDRDIIISQNARLINNWQKAISTATFEMIGDDEALITNLPRSAYLYGATPISVKQNHKYLLMAYMQYINGEGRIGLYLNIDQTATANYANENYGVVSVIDTATIADGTSLAYRIQVRADGIIGTSVSGKIKNPKLFDLTAMNLDFINSAKEFIAMFPDWYTWKLDTTGTQRKLSKFEEINYKIAVLDENITQTQATLLENIGG